MEKLKIIALAASIAAMGIMNQGCATILGGKKNTLVFKEESLPAADIFLDGKYVGHAPGKIKLHKGQIQHGSRLEIIADGYEKQELLILRKQNTLYSLAGLLAGGIPLAVDYATGNIYRPFPRSFKYSLEKDQ